MITAKDLSLKIDLFVRCNFRKRYDKAEKEFVAAKTKLHAAGERKDLLVEHLATIIEKNEERKARKLEELLKELNIDGDV